MIPYDEKIPYLHSQHHDRLRELGFGIYQIGSRRVMMRDHERDDHSIFPCHDVIVVAHEEIADPLVKPPTRAATANRRVYVANRTNIDFLHLKEIAPHVRYSVQEFRWRIAKHGTFGGEIDVIPMRTDMPKAFGEATTTYSEIGSLLIKRPTCGFFVKNDDGEWCVPCYRLTGLMDPLPRAVQAELRDDYPDMIIAYSFLLTDVEPLFHGPLVAYDERT